MSRAVATGKDAITRESSALLEGGNRLVATDVEEPAWPLDACIDSLESMAPMEIELSFQTHPRRGNIDALALCCLARVLRARGGEIPIASMETRH